MTQEADFCGDRLRLSAFLRVVADGMPERPTRFKRRFVGVDRSFDSQIQHDPGHGDAGSPPGQEAVQKQYPNNTTATHVIYSPSPQPPEIAASHLRLTTQTNSGSQRHCKQSERVQLLEDQQHIRERESTTAMTEPLDISRKTSSTPKRRHLPVNELALLRTTSSDGLPLPSVRNCPARPVYLAIANNQTPGCRSLLCCSCFCS